MICGNNSSWINRWYFLIGTRKRSLCQLLFCRFFSLYFLEFLWKKWAYKMAITKQNKLFTTWSIFVFFSSFREPFPLSIIHNWLKRYVNIWGVTFHSLLVTRWNSLVTRYSLKNHSLLVAEVARCKKSSLLVAKFARYSLQKLLVAKTHSLLVAKFARYSLQKLLVALKKELHHRCFPVNFCEL